jgi:predicted enzyme related to lactoylglutathione lyase
MGLEWEQLVIDSADPRSLGRWWAGMLGWVVVDDAENSEEFEIRPSAEQLPGLLFVPGSDSKVVKNRLHLDFRPADQQAEVNRFLRAGATRVNVGQGDVPWVVLADPEGNEFCILSARRPPTEQ